MNLETVLENAAYARPGYALASFKEAALPVYLLTARVLTLEKKSLSPIEEGCLRAVDAGLDSPENLISFLGLPRAVLTGVLAGLNAQECINYCRAVGDQAAKISLTEKGRISINEAKSVVPHERLVKLAFDPFLKRVIFVQTSALSKPREVKEYGWFEVPLCGAKHPDVKDVPLQDLDKVVERLRKRDDDSRELLALRRIERREMHFLPCVMLFYRAYQGDDVQVAFYRDDGFSVEHETAFRNLGGPEQVGANNVLLPAELPSVTEVLGIDSLQVELASLIQSEIGIVQAAVSNVTEQLPREGAPEDHITGTLREDIEKRKRAMTQRLVRCHEHPTLLKNALTSTRSRLLIVSPWITHQVVDRNFFKSLEALLLKEVKVHIGYGLADEGGGKGKGEGVDRGKQKPAITPAAQQLLEELQRRFPNFSLRFVGNTHRKHLVSDDKFAIVSSFNWLSFRGDPKKKARDELGYLVTEPDDVESLFKDGFELLHKGYDHPLSTASKRHPA